MSKTVILFLLCCMCHGMVIEASASEYGILRPGGTRQDADVKILKSRDRKQPSGDDRQRYRSGEHFGVQGIVDTLTWRSKSEPDINFGFLNPGDSLLVWFEPVTACSLIAIRFYVNNYQGKVLLEIWKADRYDPKIYSQDSTDANGWLGSYDPETGEWIPGLFDRPPLGGDPLPTENRLWGPFPYNVNYRNLQENSWIEIPARAGLQGEADLGSDPFYLSTPFYIVGGWGFAAERPEYPQTVPFNVFKFYPRCCGPDDVHDGWFIRSYSIWFEVIVKYYENMPPTYKNLYVQSDTYGSGPFQISVEISDVDAHNETDAGVALAELVYDFDGQFHRVPMNMSPQEGHYIALIPELSVGDTVTYWIEATDIPGLTSQSARETFARIEPLHPDADILVIWDDSYFPDMNTFFVNIFTGLDTRYQYEFWNIPEHDGIDGGTINWGWNTLYISGRGCANTLPGREYTGNLFVEWLEAGSVDEPHALFYSDQDYFCVHPEYGCGFEEELTPRDFMYEYFGVTEPLCDGGSIFEWFTDSVATGSGDFSGVTVNFWPEALTETPEQWMWPDWIVEVAPDAEQIFTYKYSGFGAGVRLDRGHYKTVYLPWQDYFAVDSLENGGLVPKPGMVATIERIFEWFGTQAGTHQPEGTTGTPEGFFLSQNYPNPFNAGTDIRYQLPSDRFPSHTSLKIFNILGQEVRTLVNEELDAGQYIVTWDGRDEKGTDLPSGVYFYKLISANLSRTRRMLLVK